LVGPWAFGVLGDLELHLLTLAKGLEPLGLDRGMVYEDVRTALAGDEAVALGIAEPLDCTFDRHNEKTPPSVIEIPRVSDGTTLSQTAKNDLTSSHGPERTTPPDVK
jgi:hypothetical protein